MRFKNFNSVSLAIIFLLVGLVIGHGAIKKNSSQALKTINGHSYDTSNPNWQYYEFRIQYPSNYFATTDEMLSSYLSEGGAGMPSIILVDGDQLTADPNGTDEVQWPDPKTKKCIYIYKDPVIALSEIDGAPNGTNGVTVENTQTSKVWNWPMLIRSVNTNTNSGKIKSFEAIVTVHDKIRYLFTTCNQYNKEDLLKVARSLDVRA